MLKKFSKLPKRQQNRRIFLTYFGVASQPVSLPNVDDNPIAGPSCSSVLQFDEIGDQSGVMQVNDCDRSSDICHDDC